MKAELPGQRLCQRMRRVLLKRATIVASIIGLLALFPLTGCVIWGGSSNVQPTPPAAIQGTPSALSTGVQATPTLTIPGGPWKLAWSDEFDGPAGTPPDASKWTAKVGGDGWGNQQLDYDTANKNVYQDGQGNLILEARKGNPGGLQCWYGPCRYTSAQISTEGHFSFTYGYLEARMKLPLGQGLWSAFWLLGDNCATVGWPACGEVDAMECLGSDPTLIYGTVHGPGYSSETYQLKHGSFADSFHTFGLRWDPNHLYFMVDGIAYHTVYRSGTFPRASDWVYNHPFYIIFNLPVGGEWPGSPGAATSFPQKLYISYIRLYTS